MDLKTKFRALVREIVGLPFDEGKPPIIDLLALYRARVDVCASDGSTVDVTPEDTRLSPRKNVMVRVGIPGAVAVVQAGAIVLLGWERGDPKRPYAVPSWEAGATVTTLKLNATTIILNSGTNHVARVGDATSGHVHVESGMAGPYPVSGSTASATDTIAENGGTVKSG